MDAKENFLRLVRFDQPERIVSQMPVGGIQYHGCNHEGFDDELGDDHPAGSVWTDIWGTVWHKIHPDVMGLPKGCPLEQTENLKRYAWPDPNDERIYSKIYAMAGDLPRSELFLEGSHRDTLWEKAYMLVGMETMMTYFLTEPGYAREVLHGIMNFQLGIAEHYVRAGVEMVYLGDDLGTQRGPLLGPRIVRDFLVPEYRRLFEFYKPRGVLIEFHSCGNIASVVDTFIELGVDILNPVQATANDLDQIRARTQGRLALRGAVSSKTLMDGPRESVERQVRQRLWQLGRAGGYICRPDQSMPFPPDHLQALHDTVECYGRYPIQPWM